jgi:CheY-like chemotaxis protein
VPHSSLGGSESVLLVEDDDTVRELVRQVLGAVGYTVMECKNADEAVSMSSS